MKRVFPLFLFFIFATTNIFGENLRIELKDLSTNLKEYKIIDVRDKEKYSFLHIDGALNLPSSLTYENLSLDGRVTIPNKMQEIIRDLGLNTDDKVVVYDDGSFFDASRVFWTLEVYGFKNVKLLNGGFSFWKELGYLTSSNETKVKKSDYIATINNKKLATKFSTQIARKNRSSIIIDAREYKSYIGEESVAKRFGHIPQAINLPALDNIKKDLFKSSLKDIDELREIYKDVDKDKKIVLYCSIGKIASTNYFALRELGYDVANYDASWKEWGNDFNLPVVNPSKKD